MDADRYEFEDTKMDVELFDSDKVNASDVYDKDYMATALIKTEDNYLDPNFLPSSRSSSRQAI